MSKFVTLHGFGGGSGGTELNFEVVGGTTEPSNPTENMIWVNTSTTITDYIFSAAQPNAVSGRVWISTDISSPAEFSALKDTNIQIYPIFAKQYVSGAWVDKAAKTWQGGKWVDWTVYLFKSGEGAKVSFAKKNASAASITVDNTMVKGVSNAASSSEWYYLTEEKVSLNGKSEVVMVAKCTFVNGGTEWGARLALFDRIPSLGYSPIQLGMTVYGSAFMSADGVKREYIIPVADLNDEYIIGYHGIGSVEIYDIFVR